MKWLITGATNAVGKALAKVLKNNGEYIIGVDLMGRINPVYFNEFYTACVTRFEDLSEAFLKSKPDIVVNLSYFGIQDKSFETQRNVAINGTNNFFKACEGVSLKRIVYVSSAVVYGSHENNPEFLYEADPLRSNDCYPYAKLRSIADILAQKHSQQFSFDTIILRPATVVCRDFVEPQMPFLKLPFIVDCKEDVPLQFISVEDLAYSIFYAVKKQVRGIYNLSAQGSIPTYRLPFFFNKKRAIKVPLKMASAISKLLWNLKILSVPPGSIDYFTNRWTIDASKSWHDIYVPRMSSEEAFMRYGGVDNVKKSD